MSFRLAAMSVVVGLSCLMTACGGAHMSAKAVGIFVTPRSAVAHAHSADNQIAYKVVVGYSDGRDVPQTGGVQWLAVGSWVSFDSVSATATCEYPAPQGAFNIPQPATITATATVDSQTFSDTAILDCF